MNRFVGCWLAACLFVSVSHAEEFRQAEEPQIAAASPEAEQRLKGFRVPAGLQGQLVAAEPQLANPVAFYVDYQGKIYVCETFRQSKGVEDNRSHAEWLDDDLAAQTVEDRMAYLRKHRGAKLNDYAQHDDRIRLLVDKDGDGKIDSDTVFAKNFNHPLDGTGAGVLAYQGQVYYTNIPKLYQLTDLNGDGVSDERKVLSEGYGVRYAFRGHDMHGLIIGPDGRLYFSIGDRGYNVTQGDKHYVNPESGAVFRCELDGSNLEVFATGLRNPQELAFDDYGNLFTGDNNSDSGDQARWVYVVEGGDTGWRMAYQYLGDRGPFNREKIWHEYDKNVTPAYIVPPVKTNIASGPSGLAYYPGTGLTDHFKQRFCLVDFRGGPGNSGVRTFRVKPKGAFFEVVDAEETLWGVLATDVDFGPDGALYISDWINGWNGENKGRIYKFADPTKADEPLRKEVQTLLASDFSAKSVDELAKLLAHADRRVRQEAQFALAAKNETAKLSSIAKQHESQLARLHALWALGQIARRGDAEKQLAVAMELLADSDLEVRAQAAKVLGENKVTAAATELTKLLKDDNARVQQFAAISLGKLANAPAIPSVLAMLAANDNNDPILRHGGIMALTGAGDASSLLEAAKHESPAARLAVVVAMRKRGLPEVAALLNDADPAVVLEAARAIHDHPITAALPQLAALITRSSTSDPLLRRVLNANYRLGQPENALALAQFAASADAPEAMRLEALQMLAAWETPSQKDRVLNMWRPLAARSKEPAGDALKRSIAGILRGSPKVAAEAAKVAAQFGVTEVGPTLLAMLADQTQAGDARADALLALAALKDAKLDAAMESSLTDKNAAVRAAAREVLFAKDPPAGIAKLGEAVAAGETLERQKALALLTNSRVPGTNDIVSAALDKLLQDEWPEEVKLDLIEAAAKRADGTVKQKLAKYQAGKPKDDLLATYRETLAGGDLERGKKIFYERAQVSCVRCHKAQGTGGDVGPELTKVAGDKTREYLLEALVLPNKAIAKNFESVLVITDDGLQQSGIIKSEDEKSLKLMTAEGKLLTIAKENIEERKPTKSAMPEDLTKHLTKQELRDLVEFLSSLK
ncbi:MAG TPA: PVC-type heme-binding CxxCH protein [Pirellulaceae bacterium]|nr:PVC-type heme-binding CxxCH protein [Pirellulaceae bacterium]